MPEQAPHGRSLWPGFLILGALVAIALVIFNLTALTDLTRSRYDVVAVMNEAEGVRVGSAVRVAGVESGRVTRIGIVPHGDSVLVTAQLRLDGRTRELVRTDSDVRAQRLRVIGEPTVYVAPGSPERPPVRPGDTLWSHPRLSARRVLDEGLELPRQLETLMASVDRVVAMAADRRPQLDRLDRQVDFVVREGTRLSRRLEGGSLGPLLGDAAFGERLAALGSGIGALTAAVDDAMARYVPADEETELALAFRSLRDRSVTLQAAVDSLRARMDEGRGFIPRFAEDRAIEREMAGVQAQIDSLRAEALSIALRMLLPW